MPMTPGEYSNWISEQQPLSAAPYRERVIMALINNGAAIELSGHDEAVISAGEHYDVGPTDCALQIISDREDSERETPLPEPTFFTVAVYLANRAYGGPEEGGWWYDCGQRVDEALDGLGIPRIFTDEHEAAAYARELSVKLDEKLNSPAGYRTDLSSVCCEGRYEARVCAEYPDPHYPSERPHYE